MRVTRARVRTPLIALAVAAGLLGGAVSASAQEIQVRLGDLQTPGAVAPGGQIEVPIVVDVSGTTEIVASVSVEMSWNPAHFTYVSTAAGPFGTVTINDLDAVSGALQAATYSASGTSSTFILARVTLEAVAVEGTTAPLGLAVTGIGEQGGRDLFDLTGAQGLFLCVSGSGLWGDVNGDGAVNIIDAQQVARHSVNLSVTNGTVLAEAGDVNVDAAVNIIDAQQIARYSVGLETASSRVGQLLGAGCSEPLVDELRLEPEQAQVGVDSVQTLVARVYKDGVAAGWPGGVVSWRSTDTGVATVMATDDSTAQVTGLVPGTSHIVATLDGLMASAARMTVTSGRVCNALSDFVVGAVTVGETVGGTLTTADCQDGEYYVQGWTLDLAVQDTFQIDLTSAEVDAFLYVLNDLGELVAQNDDGLGGTDATMVLDLEAGSYYVMASTALPFETGAYALTLSPASLVPEACTTLGQFVVGTVGVNTATAGTLDGSECTFDDGTLAEGWELDLLATTSLQFDLESVDFNAYLMLTDVNGNVIAENNDGGGGTNALIRRTLDAGTYYVFANTFAAAESGAYNLAVTEAAVGPSCTSIAEFFAGTVSVGQTVAGTLSTTDCLDGDWYAESWTLELTGTDTVEITLESVDFDAWLVVLDGSMVELGQDTTGVLGEDNDGAGGTDARLTLALAPGTYHILATTNIAYEVGSYTLSVLPASGAGSACSTADHFYVGAMALNSTESGSLGAEDCQFDDGSYAEAWQLDLASDTGVRIDLTSVAFDAYLILTDAAGTLIAENDDAGGNLNARIDRQLTAGTYYLYAGTYPGELGAYQLTATAAVVGPSCSTIEEYTQGSVAVGSSLGGVLTTSDCLNDSWYTEAWTLEVTQQDTVTFDMASADFASFVYVLDGTLSTVGYGYSETPGVNGSFTMELAPGTYRVMASTNYPYETGSYTLTLSAGVLGPCDTFAGMVIGSVAVGGSVNGTLAGDECVYGGAYMEGWTLELTGEQVVQIDLASVQFDALLYLVDEAGDIIAINAGDDVDTDARITMNLAAGTYRLMVSSWFALETGAYTLTVAPGTLNFCTTIAEYVVGALALNVGDSGVLDTLSCQFDDGTFAEAWELQLGSETTLQIDLTSVDFDAYLLLWDATGFTINANDDGGDGTNSRINTTLTAGTYYIVVNTFFPGEVGAYQIQVTN